MNKQTLEIPDHVSVLVKNDGSEFFGSASNFTFVNQLNHFLRQLGEAIDGSSGNYNGEKQEGLERFGLKPTVIEHSVVSHDLSLESLTLDQVNRMIVAFLETWTIPFPCFYAEQIFTLAADVWQNPRASAEDKALLYLVLLLGAATSYFDLEQLSSTAFPLAKSFFDLALTTVPYIGSQVSFEAVRVLILLSLAACSLGDTALLYVYSGLAVRVLLAIGLHRGTGVRPSAHSFDASHHRRVWLCTWLFEKYWSFCVGRPSGCSDYIGIPNYKISDLTYEGLKSDFIQSNFMKSGINGGKINVNLRSVMDQMPSAAQSYSSVGRFQITSHHCEIRVKFALFLLKLHAELYNTRNDLLSTLNMVEQFSEELDQVYFNSPDRLIIQSTVDDSARDLLPERVREWFWIRIYYLYIKLMVYRPILIFSAYTAASGYGNTTDSKTNSASGEQARQLPIQAKIKAGCDICVRTAIELATFIIDLNNRVRMVQPIIFISTYLELSSTVLLFYILSSLADIPDPLAREIWQVLQGTRSFLNGSYGSYLESTQMLARDGLESLRKLLKSKGSNGNHTYLDRIMKPVMAGLPYGQMGLESDDEGGLESMWVQTLDWLDYASI